MAALVVVALAFAAGAVPLGATLGDLPVAGGLAAFLLVLAASRLMERNRLMDAGEPRRSQIEDITELKRASTPIQRLSQLQAAISEINRVIMRREVPDRVFRAVCRACVDQGGFRLAWIGLPDLDERCLVPVSLAGPAASYLESMSITLGEAVPEGREPAAAASREMRSQVCNDVSADPSVAPWRERAAISGIGSCVGLPLRRAGRPYGVLAVYAPDKDFFDDEAVALLEDMACNVSFALDQFDREVERRQYEHELRRSEEKFRILVENLPQQVYVMDAALAFVSCNAAYAKHLGIAAHEIAGKGDYDFHPRAIAEKHERDNRHVLTTGNITEVHEECVVNGETRFIHAVRAPVRNGAGEIVGVLGVLWDITQAKRAEMRLEDLSHHLVAVQEDERRRLAGQLHERLSPNLAAIKILLSTLDSALPGEAGVRGHLQDAHALLDAATADVRSITAELRPMLLDYAGLVPALHGYASQFMRRTNVAVHVGTPAEARRLDAETESTLFRIAQEALANCARHACAKNVYIELAIGEPEVVLTIRDDGFGFDAEALQKSPAAPGAGLVTMKERAEFAGGRFTLTAHPLGGTQITVELRNGSRAHQEREVSIDGKAAS